MPPVSKTITKTKQMIWSDIIAQIPYPLNPEKLTMPNSLHTQANQKE